MKIRRIIFSFVNNYMQRDRTLHIEIIDSNDKIFHIEERLFESDAVDNLTMIFEMALKICKNSILEDEKKKIDQLFISKKIIEEFDDFDNIEDGKSIEISF